MRQVGVTGVMEPKTALRKAGNYKGAITDFTETIRLWPRSARAYYGRAAVYDALGNHSQAAQDRNKAEELRKNK